MWKQTVARLFFCLGVIHKWRHNNWIIFDTRIITLFITKALVQLSRNHWHPFPLKPWRHLWTTLTNIWTQKNRIFYIRQSRFVDSNNAKLNMNSLIQNTFLFELKFDYLSDCLMSLIWKRSMEREEHTQTRSLTWYVKKWVFGIFLQKFQPFSRTTFLECSFISALYGQRQHFCWVKFVLTPLSFWYVVAFSEFIIPIDSVWQNL